ncbi:K+ Transporter [Blattamonas nauphoetae]|uniref:K+ Transporter n=1 Tax=Blattamonas nauphoetae TaxID=2049346 RepID=A0ABQ9YKN8_9EUKA|nr:K+ Transporter [Blattamonas nauphoetae]
MTHQSFPVLIGSLPRFQENKKVIQVGDKYIVEEHKKETNSKCYSFLRHHTTFFTYHFLYFLTASLIMSGFLAISSKGTSYTDCLFTAVSALTSTGLSCIDLTTSNFGTQFILVLSMILGCTCIVSIVPVIVRIIFIRRKFDQPVVRKTIDLNSLTPSPHEEDITSESHHKKNKNPYEHLRKQFANIPPSPVLTIHAPTEHLNSSQPSNPFLTNSQTTINSQTFTPFLTFDPRYANDPPVRRRARGGHPPQSPATQTPISFAIPTPLTPSDSPRRTPIAHHVFQRGMGSRQNSASAATLTPEASGALISAIQTVQRNASTLNPHHNFTTDLDPHHSEHELKNHSRHRKNVVASITNAGYVAPATSTDTEEKKEIPLYVFSLEYQAMKTIVKAMLLYVGLWIVVPTFLLSIYLVSVPSARDVVAQNMQTVWTRSASLSAGGSYGSILWFSFELTVAAFTSSGFVIDKTNMVMLNDKHHFFVTLLLSLVILAGGPGIFPIPFSLWIRFIRRVVRWKRQIRQKKAQRNNGLSNGNHDQDGGIDGEVIDEDLQSQASGERGQELVLSYVLHHSREIYTSLFGSVESIVLALAYLALVVLDSIALIFLTYPIPHDAGSVSSRVMGLICQGISDRSCGFAFVPMTELRSGGLALLCLTMLVSIYPFTLTLHATALPVSGEEIEREDRKEREEAVLADRVRRGDSELFSLNDRQSRHQRLTPHDRYPHTISGMPTPFSNPFWNEEEGTHEDRNRVYHRDRTSAASESFFDSPLSYTGAETTLVTRPPSFFGTPTSNMTPLPTTDHSHSNPHLEPTHHHGGYHQYLSPTAIHHHFEPSPRPNYVDSKRHHARAFYAARADERVRRGEAEFGRRGRVMPVIVPSETGSWDEAEQNRIRHAIQRHPTSTIIPAFTDSHAEHIQRHSFTSHSPFVADSTHTLPPDRSRSGALEIIPEESSSAVPREPEEAEHPTSLSSLFIPPPDELSQPAQPSTSSAPKVQPPVSSKPPRHPLPPSSFVATSTITPPPLPPSSSPHPDSRPSSPPSTLTLSPAPSPTFLSRHPVLLAIYRIFQDILAAQRDSPLLRDVVWVLVFWVVLVSIEQSRLDSTSDRLTSLHLLFELSSAYANVGLSVGAFPPLNTALSLSASLSVSARLVLALVMLLGKHREMPTTIDKSISVSSFDGAADEALKLLPWTDLREMKLTQAGRDRRRRKLSERKDAKRDGVDENEANNESGVAQVEAQVDQDPENQDDRQEEERTLDDGSAVNGSTESDSALFSQRGSDPSQTSPLSSFPSPLAFTAPITHTPMDSTFLISASDSSVSLSTQSSQANTPLPTAQPPHTPPESVGEHDGGQPATAINALFGLFVPPPDAQPTMAPTLPPEGDNT